VARDQAVKLQLISRNHPGMLGAVDKMFDAKSTYTKIRAMLEREYQEKVTYLVLRQYKELIWNVQQNRVEGQKTTMLAFNQLTREHGLSAGVNALLWEALQSMPVPQLISLKKAFNDDDKIQLMKERFALFQEEHRLKMEEREAGLKEAAVDGEIVDGPADYLQAQKVVQQVKEIFGIGMSEIEPPDQQYLPPGPDDLVCDEQPAAEDAAYEL